MSLSFIFQFIWIKFTCWSDIFLLSSFLIVKQILVLNDTEQRYLGLNNFDFPKCRSFSYSLYIFWSISPKGMKLGELAFYQNLISFKQLLTVYIIQRSEIWWQTVFVLNNSTVFNNHMVWKNSPQIFICISDMMKRF